MTNKTVNVTIRMDEKVKERAEVLFNELGMNMTTAINIFLKQAIRDNGIPFKIDAFSKTKDIKMTIDDDDDLKDIF